MTIVDVALEHAARGWYTVPCWSTAGDVCACPAGASCKSPGKHPIGGQYASTIDPDVIRGYPLGANLALDLKPSGLMALDVDGDNHLKKLEALEALHGPLPETVVQVSGSGALHIVFKAPPFALRGNLSVTVENEEKPQEVTVRGLNIIVIAPSVHRSGGVYSWAPAAAPGKVAVAELPPAWQEALRRPAHDVSDAGVPPESDEPAWLQAIPLERHVADMRAHLEREVGERKGESPAGTCFNVCRTAVRAYAVRDAKAVLGAVLEIYNPRCSPEYEPAEVARRVVAAFNTAYAPPWGVFYEPPEDALKRNQEALGVASAIAALPARVERVDAAPIVTGGLPPLACDVLAIDRPPLRTYTTGFTQLDELIGGGISTRAITVPIARTGAGKSGFALGMGLHASHVHQVPFLYISTELDADESAARLAALVLGVAHRDVLNGTIPRATAREALRGLPVHVLGCDAMMRGAAGLQVVGDAIKRVSDLHGVPPVGCLDYLQMITDDDPRNVRMGVSGIANALRALTQDLDCALLAVSSTARGFYKAPKDDADNPIAYLGAAKESGDIEFAAANIIFLDVANEHACGTYAARLVVAKARRGTLGFVGAKFHGPSGRWAQDAAAVVEMSAEVRTARRQGKALTEAKATVLETVRKHGPRPWSSKEGAGIRDLSGIDTKRATAARDALIAEGAIVVAQESYFDALRRQKSRDVLRVVAAEVQP